MKNLNCQKKLMKLLIGLFILLSTFCYSQNSTASDEVKQKQNAIIYEYHKNCALKHNYKYEASQWQACLDAGLAKDSTIAYLWQQKAMPLFKARKYEAGMVFLDKAVFYDEKEYLPYRAFIKCIFAKTYKDAIVDFEKCKQLFGNNYEMDHTYDFHIALSYLQLNNFVKAEEIFKKDTEDQINKFGSAHHLDLFYYGISLFEQQKYDEAISIFNKAIFEVPNFADVKFYKALCLQQLGEKVVSNTLFLEAKMDLKNGNTINEDQIFYEMYPYQIRKLIEN
jgi:tetratricopeptide (TPR) repeat protein